MPVRSAHSQPKIEAILLAAGQSSRFSNGDKLLQRIGGKALLRHVAEQLIDTPIARLHVILPELGFADRTHCLDGLDLQIHHSPKSKLGIGASVSDAIDKIAADSDAVLVALADMPGVKHELVARVCGAHEQGKIVAPFHGDMRGHPVLFDRSFFAALSELQGDRGAQKLINENTHKLVAVPCKTGDCLIDVDTIEDMQQYLEGSVE